MQATPATSRAVRIVDKVISLLNRIRALLAKILPSALKRNVGESVVKFSGASATLSTVARIATDVVTEPSSYIGPFTNVSTGVWKREEAGAPPMSDQEIDEALDPNR